MTVLLGATALLLATLVGVPAGIITGSRQNVVTSLTRVISLIVVSVPPLVTSFGLLLLAARTGWFPVGGFPASGDTTSVLTIINYLTLPAIALALPIAASLERLQSQAIHEALGEPAVRAALARGCSSTRILWRHALRLSLKPVLAIYGVIVGSVLSGSFAVEIVTSWPGLGALMYEGLVSRDLYLVAGCAAAGSTFLPSGFSSRILRWRSRIRESKGRRDGHRSSSLVARPPLGPRAWRIARGVCDCRPVAHAQRPRRAVRRVRVCAADVAPHGG